MSQDPASIERAALVAALERVATGDHAALQEVYRRTSAKLMGICLRIFPEASDAEDALQDAFVTIWAKAGTYDSTRASPITWLATLTRNRAIDRWRASGRHRTSPIEDAARIADDKPDPEVAMMALDELTRVVRCLDTLDEGDATMIRTAYWEGTTYAELADRAALPLGTVKSRVRRALIKLRACLT